MNRDFSIGEAELVAEFVKVGQATWDLGLNSLKSGNMSLLLPNRHILITKTGRSLRGLNSEIRPDRGRLQGDRTRRGLVRILCSSRHISCSE